MSLVINENFFVGADCPNRMLCNLIVYWRGFGEQNLTYCICNLNVLASDPFSFAEFWHIVLFSNVMLIDSWTRLFLFVSIYEFLQKVIVSCS